MRRKLKSRAGETIAETLVTILIIALGSAALATMITTSGHINARAGEGDTKFYEQLSAAERGDGTTSVLVRVGSDGVPASLTGGDDELTSYRVEGGGTP